MMDLWFRQWSVWAETSLQLFSDTCLIWSAGFANASLGAAAPADGEEQWLSRVNPRYTGWARQRPVGNCAAAVYSACGANLSRMAPANAAGGPASRSRGA